MPGQCHRILLREDQQVGETHQAVGRIIKISLTERAIGQAIVLSDDQQIIEIDLAIAIGIAGEHEERLCVFAVGESVGFSTAPLTSLNW